MWNRGAWAIALLLAWICLGGPAPAPAADEEGCLFCHRLELRVAEPLPDGRDLKVWEASRGMHDALYCSDCHPDAGKAPHAAAPGPAQCLGECHGRSATAIESHRRASFGGLVETHRGLSSPRAPCRLCHRASDKAGNAGAIVARCAGCHGKARESLSRGVHARVADRASGMCPDCHVVHPAAAPVAKITCAGIGCHAQASERMKRLAAHDEGGSRGRAGRGVAEASLVLGIAAVGFFAGRRLSPPGSGKRGNG